MKSLLPWVLGGAVIAAIGYGVASSNTPLPRVTTAPVPPLVDEVVSGRGEESDEPAMPQESPLPEPLHEESLTGVVKEHHDVSQYTYVRLATARGEVWAAVYRAPLTDGTEVTVEHASPLEHFQSRELARDFDRIWFGVLPGYETARTAPPASSSSTPAAPSKPVPGALPIADLAKRADALDGKAVTVSGRVVKINEGILDRNWLHLQDGTGSAADGTNDVLVTSSGTAKVGDHIVASGKVRTKQDFGAGYAYPFLIEQASLKAAP